MHLIYLDDSYDLVLDAYVCSAIAIPSDQWKESYRRVQEFRSGLRRSDGIYVRKELHAWKFVSGRGKVADRIVTRGRRCQIFKDCLSLTASLPGARIFNVCSPYASKMMGFERLLNRINRTMEAWNSHAVLICDDGNEAEFRRMIRRLGVRNEIPSRYGVWATGSSTRNIPIERILEDPFFKRSEDSYFVQLADFVAYALLRKEGPILKKSQYGLDTAFDLVLPAIVPQTSPTDPCGVIRV